MNIGSGDAIDHDYVKLVEKVVNEEDFFGRAARNDRESRYPFENMAALKSVGVPSMAIHPSSEDPATTSPPAPRWPRPSLTATRCRRPAPTCTGGRST